MEKGRATEGGWFPLRGSYEEAVLSWHEQIEASFRRRELEAQRADQDARRLRTNGPQPLTASAD
jgi:hypothetical protein